MKGTVPHSDQPATKAKKQEAKVVFAQQAIFLGSSKAYTSAAFLGLAIASGILWPEGSRANTVSSVATLTPEMQPTSDGVSNSQEGAAQATAPANDSEWQPSLLRNLSELNDNSNRANSSDQGVESVKSPKSGLTELSESESQTPLVGSESRPDSATSPSTVQPNSSRSASQDALLNNSGDSSESLATPRRRSAQSNSALSEAAGTNQPYATPEVPGAIVIESELTDNSVSVVYRVNSGETLAQIARRHHVSVDEIIRTNNLTDPNFIQANQNLRIPQRASHRSLFQNPSSNQPDKFGNSQNLATEFPSREQSLSRFTNESRFGDSVTPSELSSKLKSKTLKPIGNQLSRVQPYTLTPNSEAESQFSLDQLATIKASGAITEPTAISSKIPFARDQVQTQLVSSTVDLRSKSSGVKSDSSSQLHTSRLRADVDRLRQEYKIQQAQQLADASQQTSEESSTPEDVTPTNPQQPLLLRRINPEFNPDAYRRQKEAAGGNTQPPEQSAPSPELTAPSSAASLRPQQELEAERDDQSVVATAPIGPNAYDPLQNPALGRIVSPDLPPLAGPDTYLPGGTMRFNGYIWPSRGILSSGYGWRWGRMHRGIDIAAPIGTPIFAAAPGVITYAGWNSGGYGNLVEIEHPDGSLTLYAHNSRVLVNKGQKVAQGHQIAEMGSTGRSTGPHLHFEIHPSGQGAVNPMALLPSERDNLSQR
ncbi:peptidoglycan DD-metalloendopeptidase family protein [Lyngbya sp. PCC 8106]|uniref:peptidoglycan DD-metalloendopeptidase family protein n=1 Tax=Lyngbya sp. (strain PCC 8106) TaxID=313612 RepID=UPI0005873B98|nr:peptidoglycan DD-metalloendopeptidase family protein [Lyngbya sp. PCC 8106]